MSLFIACLSSAIAHMQALSHRRSLLCCLFFQHSIPMCLQMLRLAGVWQPAISECKLCLLP